MASIKLTAEVRAEKGKGAARRARRDGKIPAVIYSKEFGNKTVYLPAHETFLIVKDNSNALLEVQLDGDKQLALMKDIQRHPVRRDILHIDLLAVSRTEKVDVDVPLEITGEPAPGTIFTQEFFELSVTCPAIEIPESLQVSIEGKEAGETLLVSDIELPADVETSLDPEEVVASVMIPEEEPEPEAAQAAEGEGEAAEDSGEEQGEE